MTRSEAVVKRSTNRRAGGLGAAVALIFAGVMLAQPAVANSQPTSGPNQPDNFTVVYWTKARSNTHVHNEVAIQITDDGGCGCGIAMAVRQGTAPSGTYARTNGYIGNGSAYYDLYVDANGTNQLPAGTFYTSTAVGGSYVGGTSTWYGTIVWNVPD